jgi:4-amino-4-deoxy-L-arabinose transferase-like glycosyltransferase
VTTALRRSRAPGWLWFLAPAIASAATRELWAPDEPRYAQVAKEIYEHGQYLVMHLCERLYPSKPPLLFWLAGFFGRVSGWSELAMRIPSLASTALTAWITARFARRLWSDREAALAPVVFLTLVMVLWHGGRLQIDPLLGVLTAVALLLVTRDAPGARERTRDLCLAGLCTGLGALAKGPVAWFLVGLPALAWRFLLPRPRVPATRSAIAACAALAVAPVLVWALAVVVVEPALAYDLFVRQHLERATSGTDHVNPPWYFALVLPPMLLPWTVPVIAELAAALRRWASADRGSVLAASWFAILFVFFSAITGKRELYLLPAMPAAALLAARWFANHDGSPPSKRTRWIAMPGPAILGLLGIAGIAVAFVSAPFREHHLPPPTWRAALIGLCLLAGSALAIARLRRGQLIASAVVSGATLSVAMLAAACTLFPEINESKSARALAEWVAARPERPNEIPCIGVAPEGFRFYTGRPFVKDPLELHLEREGAQFLGLAQDRDFERLPAAERARYRIVHSQHVGARTVHVLVAAEAPPPSDG